MEATLAISDSISSSSLLETLTGLLGVPLAAITLSRLQADSLDDGPAAEVGRRRLQALSYTMTVDPAVASASAEELVTRIAAAAISLSSQFDPADVALTGPSVHRRNVTRTVARQRDIPWWR